MSNSRPIPSARQLEFQDWELGLFLHFGIRTFYEGHRDWDGKPMPPQAFNPVDLDCRQWMQVCKDAGVKYTVLTAKHHDGFANWPSEYTPYSVKNAAWKDGKGDVIREYVDACAEFGIKPGIYYSPAQADGLSGLSSEVSMEESGGYDDYFINQISELLDGRYGKIDCLWFDGCGSEGHEYDWPRITGEIRKMQPDILIFSMGDPDYRWCGNEEGYAGIDNTNVVESIDFSVLADEQEKLKTKKWLPVECDMRMRDKNWFYSENDVHTVKTQQQITDVYDLSVGRGANMLINIGPDRRGHLPECDSKALIQFGQAVKQRTATPLVTLTDFIPDEDSQSWNYQTPEGTTRCNMIVIQEDLTDGESVKRFSIDINCYNNGRFLSIYQGCTIGHKQIIRLPEIRAANVRLRILEADGSVKLRSIELHHV
ncbi:MAG TPA: hypothetical protein DCM28_09935 [Phycisphaerales bacterium]|nr:hypothetical protein [Phycisphaerales bacterium]HCD32884.1 hypothetical protein [Phycisphaerales bacterium]|tara:strand:+ start:944 stop:2221 length:1278 start_codon:yes stop_codon:yes gene_type:complete